MIPDVEQYLAHHSTSEINSCAVGLGENLSAPAAHIDSVLRIWPLSMLLHEEIKEGLQPASQFPVMGFWIWMNKKVCQKGNSWCFSLK